jgi:hypothetical protein
MKTWINEQVAQGRLDFAKLERMLFHGMMGVFQQILEDLLEGIDATIAATRDLQRYELKERKSRTLQTLVGEVTFSRRYYWDRQEQEWVFLLDEQLKLDAHDRVSPGMVALAVTWATKGPSYRDAKERLEEVYGAQVLSHEGIRRIVCEVGEALQRERENREIRSEGKRRVDALFIEVDGVNAYLQDGTKGKKRKRHENKVAVVHEGWEERQSTGKMCDYRLVNPVYLAIESEAESFWEQVRGAIAGVYDRIDEIPVIVNGDGASWIAPGAECFRHGLYQYDRFHLIKELKHALRHHGEHGKEALKAVEENDAEGVLRAVRGALYQTSDPDVYEKLKGLCERLETHKEALRDYRIRLKEMGFTVDPKWRTMGAAESNMDKFKNRIGKQGRSWSLRGLTAMLTCMVELFEGNLAREVRRHLSEREEWILDRVRSGAGRVARQIIDEPKGVRSGGFPAIQRGTEGYAKLFRQLLQIEPVA